MKRTQKKIGELLKEAGLIDDFQLNSALSYQKSWGGRLGAILIKKGFVSEQGIVSVIEKQFGLPCIKLGHAEPPSEEILKLISVGVAKKYCIFPLGMEGKNLVVATTDPTDLMVFDEIGFMLGVRLKPVLALESDIMRAISEHYEGIIYRDSPEIDTHKLDEKFQDVTRQISPEAPEAGGIRTPEMVESVIEPPKEVEPKRAKPELSQKVIMESLVEVLISKGIITKEELMNRIRAKSSR